MSSDDRVTVMIEALETALAELDEQQQRIDNKRRVRKNDVVWQYSVACQQEELDEVRRQVSKRYVQLKRTFPNN